MPKDYGQLKVTLDAMHTYIFPDKKLTHPDKHRFWKGSLRAILQQRTEHFQSHHHGI